MQLTLPQVDAQFWSQWNEIDRSIYHRMPFYFAKGQWEYQKTWSVFGPQMGNLSWTPNQGDTMRTVIPTPSPHVRQFFYPNALSAIPNKDVMLPRERSVPCSIRSHCFESGLFEFYPNFTDFMNDHVQRAMDDIMQKQNRAEEIFYRGHIFHQSPYVMFPDRAAANSGFSADIVMAPQGDGNAAGTSGKTNAWLAANIANIGDPGNLSLNTINLGLGWLETDQRIPPFSGDGQPKGDNNPLDSKYLLICSGEAFNQFIYDPWLLQHKNINLDVVNAGFKANLFGRVTCRLEDMPIRIAVADNGSITYPDPEVTVLSGENAGEPIPNPDYVNAQLEVAFLMGGTAGYKKIRVGAPPKFFSSGAPEGFGNLNWNGEIKITKDILVYAVQGGALVQDTNKYGRWLQLISQVTYGCVGMQKRAVLPIIFKRYRGARNPVSPV